MPVRPALKSATEPPPGHQRQEERGAEEGADSECSEADISDIASPTDAMEGDVGQMRDVEDDGMDGFIEDGEVIDIDRKDDAMIDKPDATSMEPLTIDAKDARIPRALNAPIRPSAEEVEAHNINHTPPRPWCPPCVEAYGKEDPHWRGANSKDESDKSGIPIVSLDYDELEKGKAMTIVGKDETSGMPIQHKVQCKGPSDEWIVKKIIKDLEDLGRRDIILKTDGEPAIVALQSKVIEGRVGRTIPRNPPAYNPESNGPCEKAVQDVNAKVRVLKLALEGRLKYKIPTEAPIIEWLIEHAAFVLGRYSVGADGMTSYERLTGRKWRRPVVEFGEVVMAKLVTKARSKGKTKTQKNKLLPRSVAGVWVGQMTRTGEHIVILENGDAMRCRTVKRVPIEDRWNADKVFSVIGTPRLPAPSRRNPHAIDTRKADDEPAARDGEAQRAPEGERLERDHPEVAHGHQREVDIRELRITDRILEKFGGPSTFTPGCQACEAKQTGDPHSRGHSKECRHRIYEEMEKSAEGRALLEKKDERLKRRAELIGAARGGEEEEREHKEEPNQDAAPATPRFGEDGDVIMEDDSAIPQLDSDGDNLDDDPDDSMERDAGAREAHVEVEPADNLRHDLFGEDDDDPPPKRQRIQNLMNLSHEVERLTGQLHSLQKAAEVKEILRQLDQMPKHQIKVPSRKRAPVQANGVMDIAEIYSPPRISEMANKMNLQGGWALDLTTIDEHDGKPWDFTIEEKKMRCKKKVEADKPFMVIASPMCGPFSSLQNMNYAKMPAAEVKDKLDKAMEHVKFCLEICLKQHMEGRLFLFEHPAGATSWWTTMIEQIAAMEGVYKTTFDFCTVGMQSGGVAAKKKTKVLTNSHAIHTLLREALCRGDHWHMVLTDGRAGPCQEYPETFCRLICEGVKRELDSIKWKQELHEVFDISTPFGKLMNLQKKLLEIKVPPEEEIFDKIYEGCDFYDDISGARLDRNLAIKARKLEMDFFKRMGVYTKVKREHWMKIITTKWLEINKGDNENPNVRARLVGRELKMDKRDDLFAATPPLESLKTIIAICASKQFHVERSERFIIMSTDIKRAYFHAPATRPIFIEIPREDREPGDEGMVARLNLSLYGTRDAAMNWTKCYTELLVNNGFSVGKANPCNFYHGNRQVSVTVHGDDFTSTGRERDLKWLERIFTSKFDTKTEYLGPGSHHQKTVRILNRVISWDDDGITYEADQRHAEIVVRELGLEAGRPVTTPGSRDDAGKMSAVKVDNALTKDSEYEAHDALLQGQEATKFRAITARLNYLAQDRPDLQYAVKEVARRMASPRHGDWLALKRIGRYLLGAPRAVQKYWWQCMPSELSTFVDSDWAGCKTTCRSTSGGAVLLGGHTLKTWASTQATVAMSSAEAELYAFTKGAAMTLGIIAMCADLGLELGAKVHSDASATLSIVQRQGLGKLRHVNVQYLWVQERVRNGDLDVAKVWGKENPADLMTKHLPASEMLDHLEKLSIKTDVTRAGIAPQLNGINESSEDCWKEERNGKDGAVIRNHFKYRRELFTPIRVAGAPPAKALTAVRITRGQFDNGQEFCRRDNWTTRTTAHLKLERPWTGSTMFVLKSVDQ